MGCSASQPREDAAASLGSPPRKQRQTNGHITHKSVPLLMALDNALEAALKSGTIKLVSSEYMCSADAGDRILSRQNLEELERTTGLKIFLTAIEATAALRSNGRLIGALTYGWTATGSPDEGGYYFAAVRRFLRSADGAHIVGIFWDFASMLKPRANAEDLTFEQAVEASKYKEALACMGSVFSSAMGTTVLRHKSVPPMHPSQEGKLVVVAAPDGAIHTEEELRGALGIHGAIESADKDADGKWLVHYASHASAEAAVATGLESASAIFPVYNGWAYDLVRTCMQPQHARGRAHALVSSAASLAAPLSPHLRWALTCLCVFASMPGQRGWTSFESAATTAVLERAANLAGLSAVLAQLPPKLHDICADGSTPVIEEFDDAGLGERTKEVRAKIEGGFFPVRGDGPVVMKLFDKLIRQISNAMIHSGEEMAFEYEGEHNTAGQAEGRGKVRWPDGTEFEGEWKANMQEGSGTYRYANGKVEVGRYKASADFGEGARWSADGQTAWLLWDGKKVGRISLEEAAAVAARVGEPVPTVALEFAASAAPNRSSHDTSKVDAN